MTAALRNTKEEFTSQANTQGWGDRLTNHLFDTACSEIAGYIDHLTDVAATIHDTVDRVVAQEADCLQEGDSGSYESLRNHVTTHRDVSAWDALKTFWQLSKSRRNHHYAELRIAKFLSDVQLQTFRLGQSESEKPKADAKVFSELRAQSAADETQIERLKLQLRKQVQDATSLSERSGALLSKVLVPQFLRKAGSEQASSGSQSGGNRSLHGQERPGQNPQSSEATDLPLPTGYEGLYCRLPPGKSATWNVDGVPWDVDGGPPCSSAARWAESPL